MASTFRDLLRQRLATVPGLGTGGPVATSAETRTGIPGGAAQARALAAPNQADPMGLSNQDPAFRAAQEAWALWQRKRASSAAAGGGVPQSAQSYDQLVSRGPGYGNQAARVANAQQPPVSVNQAAAEAVAMMQRRGDTDPGTFQPGTAEYSGYTTLIGAGWDPEEARQKVLRDQLNGPSMPGFVADAAGAVGDAASAVYNSPVGTTVRKGIGFIDEQYQRPYNWAQKQTGDDIYKQAMNGGTSTTLNPYYYLDGNIEGYALDPKNKTEIQVAYEQGLDLNGDGTVDVKGGDAVMLIYNAKYHGGFFDAMVTSLGMDPLFALSLVAPAAASGRAGAQAGAEVATIANLPKAQRVLMALDRALSGVTTAGDIGNKIADLPIMGPVWAAKQAGRAVGAVPKVGTTVRKGIGWLAEPSDATVARKADNAARDVAETVTNIQEPVGATTAAGEPPMPRPNPADTPYYLPERSVTNPPEFVGTPYGTAVGANPVSPMGQPLAPMLPERSTYPDFEVGPGGQAVARADAPVMPPDNRPMPAPEAAPAAPVIPIRRSNAGGKPTTYVGYDNNIKVVARDGGIYEVQVRKQVGKSTRWVPEKGFNGPDAEAQALDHAKSLVPGSAQVDEAADAATPPVTQAQLPEPAAPEPMTPRYGADAPVAKPYLLEEAPKAGTTWKSYLATNHPEAYQRIRAKLGDTAYAYEVRINQAPTNVDRAIERGAWAATLKRAAKEEGITDLPPWERGPLSRDAARAGNDDMRVERVIFEPDEATAKADRNVLYTKGLLQKTPPRADLADDIRNGTLKRGKVTLIENGEPIPYTNGALLAMPIEARDEIARTLVAQQQQAFERYRRIMAIREELHGPVSGARSSTAADFVSPGTRMMMDLTDALDPVGRPVAPRIPDTPLAEGRLAQHYDNDYARMNTPQQWRQTAGIDDETYDYLVRTVGDDFHDVDASFTAYDHLADIIDKKAAAGTIDWTKTAQAEKARREIINEFAALMKELTGKPLPPAVKRNLLGKALRGVTNTLGTMNQIAREGFLFNPITGGRGWAQDFISNAMKAVWEGNTGAVGTTIADHISYLRNVPDSLDQMASRLGIDIQDDIRIGSKFDTEVEASGRTALNRAVSNTIGATPGGTADRVTGFLTGAFSSKKIAQGRRVTENAARRAIMYDEMELLLPGAAREFRRVGAKIASEQYGILDSSFYAYVYDLGDQFSPADVRRAMLDLGKDAGLPGNAINEFADKIARAWRNQVSTIRNQAYDKTKQVYFTYDRTNADEFFGKFIFYHYWMSRALPSYTRIALRNPELAALWFRAWDETMKRAEEKGFPPGLRGFIRYWGSPEGWNFSLNPLQFFIPFDVLIQDPYADTTFEQLTNLVMISPVAQGVLAAAGMSSRVPDFFGLSPVLNFVTTNLNWMRSNGYLGLDMRFQNNWYEQATAKAMETVNNFLVGLDIPFVDRGVYLDRNTYNQEVLDYVLRDVIAEDMGIPFGPVPEWQVGGKAYQAWSDAKLAWITGEENEYASEAFRQWADPNIKNTYINSILPGGSRVRYGPRDTAMLSASTGYDTLNAGGALTPEQQADMDFQSVVRAGSDQDLVLTEQAQAFKQLGNERETALWGGYWSIINPDRVGDGDVLVIGNEVYYGHQIKRLSESEREVLAKRWLASYDGQEEFDAYSERRKTFLAENPEYGDFKEFERGVYGYEGGPRKWRTDQARNNPNFAAEMGAVEQRYRDEGKTGEVLAKELDGWAASMAGYKAASGIRDSNRKPEPLPVTTNNKPDFGFTADTGGSKTSTPSAPKSTPQKIGDTIARYYERLDAATLQLAAAGYDESVVDLVNHPYYGATLQPFDIPEMPDEVRLYLAWQEQQPTGADTSIEAYIAFLEGLALRPAA